MSNLSPPSPGHPGAVRVRPITPNHLSAAAALLAPQAPAEQSLAALRETFSDVDLADGRVVFVDNRPAWAVLPLTRPGPFATLVIPPTPAHAAEITPAVREVLARLKARGVARAQLILDDAHAHLAAPLGQAGLSRCDRLLKLICPVPTDSPSPLPPGLVTLPYEKSLRPRFAALLETTYDGSQDSPGWHDDPDAALADHAAGVKVLAGNWVMLLDARQTPDSPLPVGLLLLGVLPEGEATLSYLGLTPAGRGKGLADVLMRIALQLAAASGCRTLSLTVDEQNVPALRLYARHGMRETARLTVLSHSL